MSKYFVWVQGLKGPEPQIWDENKTLNGKPVATLFKTKVPDNESLNYLIGKYPFEAKP